MTTDQVSHRSVEAGSSDFAAFYRAQAPAVFDLALRHGGDHAVAADCVDAVFSELAGHWRRVSDPVRFSRRAAVLFLCGSRRRAGGLPHRCRPALVR